MVITVPFHLPQEYPSLGGFPGGLEVKTLCFHCRAHRFNPWSAQQEKKKRISISSEIVDVGFFSYDIAFNKIFN